MVQTTYTQKCMHTYTQKHYPLPSIIRQQQNTSVLLMGITKRLKASTKLIETTDVFLFFLC